MLGAGAELDALMQTIKVIGNFDGAGQGLRLLPSCPHRSLGRDIVRDLLSFSSVNMSIGPVQRIKSGKNGLDTFPKKLVIAWAKRVSRNWLNG